MQKKTSYILLLLLLISIVGCRKRVGCTDKDATNYQPEAEKDCDCCVYEGSFWLWYSKDSKTRLQSKGITALYVTIDGQNKGKWAITKSTYGCPQGTDCGSGVTYVLPLGHSRTKAISWSISDDKGRVMISESDTLEVGYTVQVELTY